MAPSSTVTRMYAFRRSCVGMVKLEQPESSSPSLSARSCTFISGKKNCMPAASLTALFSSMFTGLHLRRPVTRLYTRLFPSQETLLRYGNVSPQLKS